MAVGIFLALIALPAAAQAPPPTYMHRLADFSGELPYDYVPMHADEAHNEVYLADADAVRVFNPSGMEIFQFFNDRELGAILDLTVDPEGQIFVLSHKYPRPSQPGGPVVARFDYRGRLQQLIHPQGVPVGDEEFIASYLEWRDGSLFWVDTWRKLIVKTDLDGQVVRVWDLAKPVAGTRTEEEPQNPATGGEITGFAIDREGRFLFTIRVFFQAFRLEPDTGELTAFGRAGSGPGKFGLIGGITEDAFGQIYVADQARSVVLIFDRTLRFVREFGTRGPAVTQLVSPQGVTYGGGRLYVSQWGRNGVSVFNIGIPSD